ncbi:hypothetical protein ACSBR1_017520 [Camellia fascicularis]
MQQTKVCSLTGANGGMGLEICRQLASNGVMVVLTARDEKKGIEAIEKLKENGLSDLVVFHQLDVLDPSTIASLADFIKTQFGRLDILVNNAAIGAITVDTEALKASAGVGLRYLLLLLPLLLLFDSQRIVNVSSTAGKLQYVSGEWDVGLLSDAENLSEDKVDEILTDLGEKCLEINYYWAKRMIEALIPLLDFSDSPRIVNVSSSAVKLKFVPNE